MTFFRDFTKASTLKTDKNPCDVNGSGVRKTGLSSKFYNARIECYFGNIASSLYFFSAPEKIFISRMPHKNLIQTLPHYPKQTLPRWTCHNGRSLPWDVCGVFGNWAWLLLWPFNDFWKGRQDEEEAYSFNSYSARDSLFWFVLRGRFRSDMDPASLSTPRLKITYVDSKRNPRTQTQLNAWKSVYIFGVDIQAYIRKQNHIE